MKQWAYFTFILLIYLAVSETTAASLLYRPYRSLQYDSDTPMAAATSKRSNAELINGLIGMDLNTLSAIGKRSNAELINGLLGMNLNKLSSAGK